jgi:photosystem II stability/assembly factor-like uncharacterized protein
MSDGLRILVATDRTVLRLDGGAGWTEPASDLGDRRPSAVAWDPWVPGRAWCGTTEDGVLCSRDGGNSWEPSGLAGQRITALAPSQAQEGLIWAGTEPSAVWKSSDGGRTWERSPGLNELRSSSEWSFPPRPETHHVRWIAIHPTDADVLWVAVEAGALVRTRDGGRSWTDRVEGGPYDTHELAVHPDRPKLLRVSAGDGYFESHDGGDSWTRPRQGLEVTYLRSVAVDPGHPDTVLVSASSGPRSAYVAGRSDGRVYRRDGEGPWERIRHGWPDPPATIAPLLRPGLEPGEFLAADERGLHWSMDGGRSWRCLAPFRTSPEHLRGLAVR